MRIGTWNLDARWDERHRALLLAQDCDVWLLTEVADRVAMPGFVRRVTAGRMARQQHWAAVFAAEGRPVTDPDPATAALVTSTGLTCWSSVLPWPAVGSRSPWEGGSHDERVATAVAALRYQSVKGTLVWGGDWNHSLEGRVLGSRSGRQVITELVGALGLQVPTATLPHRIDGLQSIDHIAVPGDWRVHGADRVVAVVEGKPLSDHDLYVVDVEPA